MLKTWKIASSAAVAASDNRPRSQPATGAYGSCCPSDLPSAASSRRFSTSRARFNAAMSLECSSCLSFPSARAFQSSPEGARSCLSGYRSGRPIAVEQPVQVSGRLAERRVERLRPSSVSGFGFESAEVAHDPLTLLVEVGDTMLAGDVEPAAEFGVIVEQARQTDEGDPRIVRFDTPGSGASS